MESQKNSAEKRSKPAEVAWSGIAGCDMIRIWVEIATGIEVSRLTAIKVKTRIEKSENRFTLNAFSKLYPQTLWTRLTTNEKRRGRFWSGIGYGIEVSVNYSPIFVRKTFSAEPCFVQLKGGWSHRLIIWTMNQ